MTAHQPTPRRVDAVVVSYNNRDTIGTCVRSLLRNAQATVTVVDNDSHDDTLAVLADLDVRAIPAGRNGGFGAGCNLGVAAGSAPFVLLLNPDAQLVDDALDRMVEVFEHEPDVALVGPRLLDDDGSLVLSMRRVQRNGSVWARALYLHRLFPRARWANEIDQRSEHYERAAYPEWISGACMLVRRSAFESVSGFDDGFFLYCEDQDLCVRLRAAGGRIRYEPSAVVRHTGGHSGTRSGLLAVLARSRIRFASKHSGRLSAASQRLGVATEALTHALVDLARRSASARGHRAALTASLSRARTSAGGARARS